MVTGMPGLQGFADPAFSLAKGQKSCLFRSVYQRSLLHALLRRILLFARRLAPRHAGPCCWILCLAASAAAIARAEPAQIDTPFLRFTINPADGACLLTDKSARVTWGNSGASGLGWVKFASHGGLQPVALRACEIQQTGNELALSFVPFTSRPWTQFHVYIRALPDRRTLDFSYQEDDELEVDSVSLLDDFLEATASGQGYALVPVREGLLVPADSGRAFTRQFDTYAYEGCHMAMLGLVQSGAAALFTWDDPYITATLQSIVPPATSRNPQRLSASLVLTGPARSFRLTVLGKGDYVTVAKAYRQVAQAKGWWVNWAQKLRSNPDRAKLFGAANIKLWSALDRRMNPQSTQEESVHVNWTFSEAAQVADHLKNDLKLDKVLFTLGGWIHRGYDNQHPDILPTAPECGGNAAFADCARHVRDLGYLFCLHDNYQDIYRDSPSWNEALIMKNDDGHLVRGGRWAGGQAWLICSAESVGLAERPQNLPGVATLCGANAYFIDTTYAAGLQECYAPDHALTRMDDMRWKQALSDYARATFGVFGSEDGREWAIPHSDFFEGLTGVSGHAFHDANLASSLGAKLIPLFDLVYHDCIAAYGKYGYDPQYAAAYVLRHISLARPLNYHSIPPHLYWQQAANSPNPTGPAGVFCRADNGWAAGFLPLDRFLKNTCEVLSPLNELTARLELTRHQFLTSDGEVQETAFGKGADAVEVVVNFGTNTVTWHSKAGGPVLLPQYGFVAEGRTFAAFHASRWAGLDYPGSALFTLRSLDGKPLSRSHRVRVFHAFGEAAIKLGKRTHSVSTEQVVDPAAPDNAGR